MDHAGEECGARTALVVLSVAALAATGAAGWLAWRRRHIVRVRFLMVMGLILSMLFAIGIVYESLTIWMVPLCEPGVSA